MRDLVLAVRLFVAVVVGVLVDIVVTLALDDIFRFFRQLFLNSSLSSLLSRHCLLLLRWCIITADAWVGLGALWWLGAGVGSGLGLLLELSLLGGLLVALARIGRLVFNGLFGSSLGSHEGTRLFRFFQQIIKYITEPLISRIIALKIKKSINFVQ